MLVTMREHEEPVAEAERKGARKGGGQEQCISIGGGLNEWLLHLSLHERPFQQLRTLR